MKTERKSPSFTPTNSPETCVVLPCFCFVVSGFICNGVSSLTSPYPSNGFTPFICLIGQPKSTFRSCHQSGNCFAPRKISSIFVDSRVREHSRSRKRKQRILNYFERSGCDCIETYGAAQILAFFVCPAFRLNQKKTQGDQASLLGYGKRKIKGESTIRKKKKRRVTVARLGVTVISAFFHNDTFCRLATACVHPSACVRAVQVFRKLRRRTKSVDTHLFIVNESKHIPRPYWQNYT